MKNLIKALVSLCFTSALLSAQSGINYQGRLTNSSGAPVTGTKTFSIAIYPSATGGLAIYSESIGSVTLDANGVYGFQFGVNGTSVSAVSLSLGSTAVGQAVYSKVLPEAAIAGSVSVSDGVNTWSQSTGSSSPATFLGSYDSNSRTVTAIYLSQIPSVSRSITVGYSRSTSGLFNALATDAPQWLELTVDSNVQVPREKMLAVPFALKSSSSQISMAAEGALKAQIEEMQTFITLLVQRDTGLATTQLPLGTLSYVFDSPAIPVDQSVVSTFPERFKSGVLIGFHDIVKLDRSLAFSDSTGSIKSVLDIGSYYAYSITANTGGGWQYIYSLTFIYTDGTKATVYRANDTSTLPFINPNPSKKISRLEFIQGYPSSSPIQVTANLRFFDQEITITIPGDFPKCRNLGVFLRKALVANASLTIVAKNAAGSTMPLKMDSMNDIGTFVPAQLVLSYTRPLTSESDAGYSIINGLVVRAYD